MVTSSASQTTLILSVRLVASMLVFILLPKIASRMAKKDLCILLDVLRFITILLVIFCTNIYQIIIITIILSFCSGLNNAIRTSAYQELLKSKERLLFISKQQSIFVICSLFSPLIAAIIIKLLSIKVLFVIEALCFLFSASIFTLINNFRKETSTNKGYVGLKFLLKDYIQRNILIFRLFILTAMVTYQIISTYIITVNYKVIANIINLPIISNYSDILAYFSVVSSLALLIGNFVTAKAFKTDEINLAFTYGAILVCLGSYGWGIGEGTYLLIYYTLGTILIFVGLAFLRIALYTSGQELTPPEFFSEIIAASDLIARSYQALLGVSVLSLVPILTSSGVFLILGSSALASILVSRKINKKLKETQNHNFNL